MKRFRFTLTAICLVLLFLGGNDLLLWFGNPSPRSISIGQLEASGAPQEWLTVEAGYLDLDRAISTSGSVELEALLVPLVAYPGQERIRVLVETRDPQLLQLFTEYHFFMDTLPEKQAFRREHAATFTGQRNITGMLVAGLIVRGNQQKLLKLARQTELDIADDVIFLSSGKAPGKWRGLFFSLVGLFGLIRVVTYKKQGPPLERE